ncbi:hypothetical protein L6205_16090 [Pseudomonas syringae pv. syringae]|uniref:hypothetical protein n=1 Tax=Pseudomonas syringae TaxID=317 RepID=UPI000CD36170|nr:hypothetical protein [Pseudomonas syringae]MCH5530676.1 hypothetical protein [Pseudomonas syringae pv. syringae]MCH5540515.1 hypothetical protein [Pseudomonas syringae pv. syringae]MCH5545747.1 hypothetical protein [Pseudomonas syringae pv. syringae]MCH5603890.1 hypothetical protein [Pseudomonas syringae pv. syringae]MCH5609132.1 hypothetical protein [Pseudomonas syringae pv. syringae]
MRVEVMQYYSLTLPLNQAGYFETAHHQQLIKDIKGAIFEGRLIALCGVIGSGKTVMLRRLQQVMEAEKKITVSKPLPLRSTASNWPPSSPRSTTTYPPKNRYAS